MTKEHKFLPSEIEAPRYSTKKAEIIGFFEASLEAYRDGRADWFPSNTQIADWLFVHRNTVSSAFRDPQLANLREHKPNTKKHKSGYLIKRKVDAVIDEYKQGKRKTLPTQLELADQFGVDPKTVEQVFHDMGDPYSTVKKNKHPIAVAIENIIAEVEAGTRDSIPSDTALGKKLGFSTSRIGQVLRESGLRESFYAARDKVSKEASKDVIFRKRKQDAWFLGAMFGGGSLKERSSMILTSKDDAVLQTYKFIGEDITGLSGLDRQLTDRINPAVVFHSRHYTDLLYPFSLTSRVDTLTSPNYEWLRDDPFIGSFVGGMFDAGGNVSFSKRRRRVEFATREPVIADFIVSTLKRIGIQTPRVDRQGRDNPTPKRVYLGTISDLKIFASMITSVSPEKQSVLDAILQYKPTQQEMSFRRARAKHVYP